MDHQVFFNFIKKIKIEAAKSFSGIILICILVILLFSASNKPSNIVINQKNIFYGIDFKPIGSKNNFKQLFLINENFNAEISLLDNLIKDSNKLQKLPYISYKVKPGDTLAKIASKFGIKTEDIIVFNNLSRTGIIEVGRLIKIPGIAALKKIREGLYAGKYVSAGAYLAGIFIPVGGFNWGEKHGHNGTDIAAPCGSPVYAAKEGLVIIASYGWNGGYGNMVQIQHSDGSSTVYGHLKKILVKEGDFIEAKTIIGYVGNTGFVYGKNGCHLHFEVRGGTNPLLQ